VTDNLECLAPVSSLVSGLPAHDVSVFSFVHATPTLRSKTSALVVRAEKSAIVMPAKVARQAEISSSSTHATIATGDHARVSVAVAALNVASARENSKSVDTSFLKPHAKPASSSAASMPSSRGAAANYSTPVAMTVANALRGNAQSQSTASASAVAVASTTAGTIRPLSLSPSASSLSVKAGGMHALDDSGGSGGSGGGDSGSGGSGGGDSGGTIPPDMAPLLMGSGGNQGAMPVKDANGNVIPGQFTFGKPIPIGTIMTLEVMDPAPGYNIGKADWYGGNTNYNGYASGDATSPVNGGQSLGQGVNTTNTTSITYILDSTQSTFTEFCSVDYDNGAHGLLQVTYTTDAPCGTLTASQVGTQTAGNVQGQAGQFAVALAPPIQIQASASTDQFTAGDFMFLSILNKVYQAKIDALGQSSYRKNDYVNNRTNANFNGSLQDSETGQLGYGFYYRTAPGPLQNVQMFSSFALAANGSMPAAGTGTPEMQDQPSFQDFNTNQMMTVTESFSTYLMYRPTGGVWIALDELDWNWTETATNATGVLTGPTSAQPAPTETMPSGANVFPTWVNTTTNFNGEPFTAGSPGP
jgi:hypothetical protein